MTTTIIFWLLVSSLILILLAAAYDDVESSVFSSLETAEEEEAFEFLDDSMDILQQQQQQIQQAQQQQMMIIGQQQQRKNNHHQKENHLLLDDGDEEEEEISYYFYQKKETKTTGIREQRRRRHRHGRQRRRLSNNLLVDPKSVQLKKVEEPTTILQHNNDALVLPATTESRNVLALGGSVTWGAGLTNRFRTAYPYLLSVNPWETVDNLAIRATGASYPSLCIQSMITKKNGSSSSSNAEESNEMSSYDVIILDFVLNGTQGFALLIERLRKRFPNAILIYVKLWSFRNRIECSNGLKPNNVMNSKNKLHCNWVWRKNSKQHVIQIANINHERNHHRRRRRRKLDILNGQIQNLSEAEDIILDAGGYIYALPFPTDRFVTPQDIIDSGWFCSDFHHLSEIGHAVLARGLLDLLSSIDNDADDRQRQKGRPATTSTTLFRGGTTTNGDDSSSGANLDSGSSSGLVLGSWGQGDQCYNWFASGDTSGIHYSGATMKTLPVPRQSKFQSKHVLAVTGISDDGGGHNNDGSSSSTVAILQFRSHYDHTVPVYIAYLGSLKRVVINDGKHNIDKFSIVTISVNDSTLHTHTVDPNGSHDNPFYATVSMFQLLGWSRPGDNTIKVQTVTRGHEPFQILGIMLCEYCAEFESKKLLLK